MVKKNTARTISFVGKDGKRTTRRLPVKRYTDWEKIACLEIKLTKNRLLFFESIKCPLIAKFTFHFKNRSGEPDLSALYEGIQDVLQKCGIIYDDKLIHGHDGSRKVFGQEEGLYVDLYKLEEA